MHDGLAPPDGEGGGREPRPRSVAELEAAIAALVAERDWFAGERDAAITGQFRLMQERDAALAECRRLEEERDRLARECDALRQSQQH